MGFTENERKLFTELSQLKTEKYFAWFKQLLIIAIALFSALISLHKNESSNKYEKILFATTIIELGMGILSGCIFLFSESDIPRQAGLNLLKQKRKQAQSGIQPDKIIFGHTLKIYVFCKWISYICLSLSIPTLIWYAIQLDH